MICCIYAYYQYYGARYYDCKLSRWISADPPLATGEYLPSGDKKRNANLPGMGGVFNSININGCQYSFNNPIVFKDPDGNAYIMKPFKGAKSSLYCIRFHSTPMRIYQGVAGLVPFGQTAMYAAMKLEGSIYYDEEFDRKGVAISTVASAVTFVPGKNNLLHGFKELLVVVRMAFLYGQI